jgi:hypothetical protein
VLRDVISDLIGIAAIMSDINAGRPVDFRLNAGEAESLLAVILRSISIDDGTFAEIMLEAGIELGHNLGSAVIVSVPFVTEPGGQQIPITELAVSSTVM